MKVESRRPLAAITGSSRGLGFAIALRLAKDGHDILLINRHSKTLEEAAERIRQEAQVNVEIAPCDLLDENACVQAVRGKPIEAFVNCGIYQGSGMNARVDQTTAKELKDTFQANVLTPVFMIQEILKHMLKVKRGQVFQLVSGSSRTKAVKAIDKGGFQSFSYTSSKAAIAKLIPLLALEYSEIPNIGFFNIDPGLVITDKMREEGTAKKFEKWGVVPPEYTAEVICQLCKPDAELSRRYKGAEYVDVPIIYQQVMSSKL
jgi:NAD(P)-dependent dehydrogenase (short-subunit alcohol dehydrogenase family)